MSRLILTVLAASALLPTTAFASDASADFVIKLFVNVCIPNVGKPENVRAWAVDKKLAEIKDVAPLTVFVGPGDLGAAWAIPMSYGSFALAIRGKTQACAVYARAAEPAEVEDYFKKLLEGVARPGLAVKVVEDTTAPGPRGAFHTKIYSVSAAGHADRGNLYTLQTAQNVGGAFQVSLQAAGYSDAGASP